MDEERERSTSRGRPGVATAFGDVVAGYPVGSERGVRSGRAEQGTPCRTLADKTTLVEAMISEAGMKATARVKLVPLTRRKVEPLSNGGGTARVEGGGGGQETALECPFSWVARYRRQPRIKEGWAVIRPVESLSSIFQATGNEGTGTDSVILCVKYRSNRDCVASEEGAQPAPNVGKVASVDVRQQPCGRC